ncbi:MAG: carboxypeptidase-like regulatory domain-containing protein [Methanobacteriota archaeon]
MPVLSVFSLLSVMVIGGCVGGSEEEVGPATVRQDLQSQANVNTALGGVQGLVTDPAIVPLADALVTIVETGKETRSIADGSFAFSLLSPGTYTLVASLEGYETVQKGIEVRAGSVAVVDFVLAQLASQQPYHDVLEFAGFVECSVAYPPSPVIGQAFSVCSLPNGVLGDNATNDKFAFVFDSGPNPSTWVFELKWGPTVPTAQAMSLVVEPDPLFNDLPVRYGVARGKGPLHLRVDREKIEEVDANFTKLCGGEEESVRDADAYCRDLYAEKGGPLLTRAFVANRALADDPPNIGVAFQQDYTQYASMFYHAPAPAEWSVVSGST